MLKAVIFDMDGVLADTEPLWRKCMIRGFNAAGITFTDEDCKSTTGMRLDEVILHWHKKRPFYQMSPMQLNAHIIDDLCTCIMTEPVEMKGVREAIAFCVHSGLKVGLATSSAMKIVNTVLQRIEAGQLFQRIESAEYLMYGKPHPQVFLNCAEKLGVDPRHCIVIEDSVNGVIAAKAAMMKAVAIPDALHFDDPRFSIADKKMKNLLEFIDYLKTETREIHA